MTIFLSDLHLGHRMCKAGKLVSFLSGYDKKEILYLVGDVVDDAALKHWPARHIDVLRELLSFPQIIYTPGNHDGFMEAICGLWGKVTISETDYFRTGDEKYLVTHGHHDDPSLLFTAPRWLRRHWPMTGRMHTVTMASFLERRIVKAAKDGGYDGVICGHTHHPENKIVDGIRYMNCGDWFYSCTALVHRDGAFKLVRA